MDLPSLFSTLLFTSCVLLSSGAPKDVDDYDREFMTYDYESEIETLPQKSEFHQEIKIKPEGGYIQSEGFPDKYPRDSNFTWTLIAPQESRIRVLLIDLRLEPSDGCMYDYLAIFDGENMAAPKIAQLCDRHTHLTYSSTSSQITITFISDSAYEESGFHLEYMLEMGNHCNVTLSDREGTITSPNYPDNYDDDTNCWTIIRAQNPEEQVLINFNTVKVEYGETCNYDYVQIFDGVSKATKSLGRFCDTPSDSVMLSTSGSLLVHFHSDHLINNVGFSLKYSIISPYRPMKNPDANDLCLWEMGKLNGTITSPGFPHVYEPDEECLFLLEAPMNQKIALTMGKIVMDGHDNCDWDYIEVRNGHNPDSELLGKFCGRPIDAYQTVTSSSNKMWVKFVSDSYLEYQGFIARYKIVDKAPSASACKYCHETKFEEPLIVSTKPQNATLSRGEKHTFNCISNAETKPTWMKNFVPLVLGEQIQLPGLNLLTNHSLVIESMSRLLEGVYTCTIVSSKDIQVYNAWITYVPSAEEKSCDIQFNVIPQSIVTIEGSYTFLRCSTVNLHTQITWMKENVILTENTDPRFRIILPGLLLIHPLLPHDTANYKCIAKKYGCVASVSASIGVKHKPDVGCGIAAVKKSTKKPHEELGKIVGGEKSVEGSNPWQAMLYHAAEGSFCGGSIVNIEWVVTAAHCFRQFSEIFMTNYKLKLEDVTVKLGKHDSLRTEPNEQGFKLKEIFIHPQYHATTYDNDIALLQLEKPIDFNTYISPICLGHGDLLTDNVYSKQVLGIVSGWGRTETGGRKPRYLREVSLPVVDQDTCMKSVSKEHVVTENMFCAGFAQQMVGDSCQGDSGGPFAVQIKESWYLAGVVSWGEGCAAEGKYGFYTKAGNYYNWILDTIQLGSIA